MEARAIRKKTKPEDAKNKKKSCFLKILEKPSSRRPRASWYSVAFGGVVNS